MEFDILNHYHYQSISHSCVIETYQICYTFFPWSRDGGLEGVVLSFRMWRYVNEVYETEEIGL